DRFHLLGVPYLLFELASLGHILDSADHPRRDAMIVAQDVGLFEDPPHIAVSSDDAVLDLVWPAVSDRRHTGVADRRKIVRMHEREKGIACPLELACLDTEDAESLGRPAQTVRA